MSNGNTTEGRGVSPRMVIGLVLLAVVAVFAFVNTDDVKIDYVFGDSTMPLIIVLLVVLAVGLFVGYVGGLRHDND
jgi:uncharacterized integral membrane protein